ncbi:MAG: hypothetical protein JW725_04940 [Candidatus Babeliaceae bacterium]|nr:hypothetical protein [Candidatus Babeliaceae bacterium]
MSVRCLLGIHKWSNWEYKEETSCLQIKKCQRCNKTQEELIHKWGEWEYKAQNSCIKIKKCYRCGERRERKPTMDKDHQYVTEYSRSNSCHYFRKECTRCGHTEEKYVTTPVHSWGDWVIFKDEKKAMRVCKHCGGVQTKELQEYLKKRSTYSNSWYR